MKIKNSKEQLKQKLNEKISKEYEAYKENILKKGSDEVLEKHNKISAYMILPNIFIRLHFQ